MLKPDQNPPIIWAPDFAIFCEKDCQWPAGKSIANFDGLWWVVHTKSRNEKALAHDLIGRQINYFLPMTRKIRRHRGRTIRSLLPLFSGYLFFCGQKNDRLKVLQTNRVANVIEVKDQQKLLAELTKIEHALHAGAPLAPHRYIKAGRLCRVTAGPLAGLDGIVIKTKTTTRLILKIDILGQAASVEIDTDMIEFID